MPRNRYSSALLFPDRQRPLRATNFDDPGMSKGASTQTHARASYVPQRLKTEASKAQPPASEIRAQGDTKDVPSNSVNGRQKTITRKPVGSESRNQQQASVERQSSKVSRDRVLTKHSNGSKETAIYSPISTTSPSTKNNGQFSRNASSASIGRKPPPVPPAAAGRSYWRRRAPSNDTITILGTPLPVDASVNLAYHELLKESNGSDAHPAPETLRNSMVSVRPRTVSGPDTLAVPSSELSLGGHAEALAEPADTTLKKESIRPASCQSTPKSRRDRDATRKELTALLTPHRRKPLPPEPVVGIPPATRKDSRPASTQALTMSPKLPYGMFGEPRMTPIPEPGETSPSTGTSPHPEKTRSLSLTSISLLSPASIAQKNATPPPPPTDFSRDPLSTLPNPRNHNSLTLLPSLLRTPSSKDPKTVLPQRHHLHRLSLPGTHGSASASIKDAVSLPSPSSSSSETASLVSSLNSPSCPNIESSPDSPHSFYLPRASSNHRDLADLLPVSAPDAVPSPKFKKGRERRNKKQDEDAVSEVSADEAVPPPIARNRRRKMNGLGVGASLGSGLDGLVGSTAGRDGGRRGGGMGNGSSYGSGGGWFRSLRERVRGGSGSGGRRER